MAASRLSQTTRRLSSLFPDSAQAGTIEGEERIRYSDTIRAERRPRLRGQRQESLRRLWQRASDDSNIRARLWFLLKLKPALSVFDPVSEADSTGPNMVEGKLAGKGAPTSRAGNRKAQQRINFAECREHADHYKRLSRASGISKDRAAVLKNIARSFVGLAGQLDRLASLARNEQR